ncbi:unnamed protein product [Allacma fusca]|uniref:NAD-dependent protein deacylase n=1 Tax=Allacma fusca TaxID=39272 RepID=A0A8J2M602_9HEXA|nr:unnamed protein product [Allacma fusca]
MPPSADMETFRKLVNAAKHVVILTGAGVSAESGVPTFRGAGGYWRQFEAQQLATLQAFRKNPSLVWEFYHYRREVVLTKEPNPAHLAIAEFEKRLQHEGKKVVVITQNVDDLHVRAGTEKLIRLHGSLFQTKCMNCSDIAVNFDSPICPALKDKGKPDTNAEDARIPVESLPRCQKCQGLVRPGVIWFGENLNEGDLTAAGKELEECDLCLVVGTSSVVYPAAMFAPQVAARGVPVAEFNLESTPATSRFGFHFEGPCGKTLPQALSP